MAVGAKGDFVYPSPELSVGGLAAVPKPDATAPIAVIGLSCRFPGASDAEQFWRLLRDGIDATADVPPDRFNIAERYDPAPAQPGRVCTRRGGFVADYESFDSQFFGIAPREALSMDPQQRLLLEVAWEALENAGQVLDPMAGMRAGVFVGACGGEYGDIGLYCMDPARITLYTATGAARSVLSGRLSYFLGCTGPSLTVDTACSSSLVALHLACNSLNSGESELAVVGGVNLLLRAEPSISFSQAGMLARDGRCKAFDASADGFVRSDGVGVVILKPLAKALAARDPIRAAILGTAVNNDGRSSGYLLTPAREGQERVLRDAYARAGILPGGVHYVEAHGTGTAVGDPVEVAALSAVMVDGRDHESPCRIGSVKTNIGHTEAAAGIAGLIKVILAMEHRQLPASLHVASPNPAIPWSDIPVVVQRALGPWPSTSETLVAAVSSFGISGTNAHAVLRSAPRPVAAAPQAAGDGAPTVVTLSAPTPAALVAMARRYTDLFNQHDGQAGLADIAYTSSVRRHHHECRIGLVVQTKLEAVEKLEAFLAGETRPGLESGRADAHGAVSPVFVFPGQGTQWLGMGRSLITREPVFRETLRRCDAAMRPCVNWSLFDAFTDDEAPVDLNAVDVIQPMLFALQVALAEQWRSWGVLPSAVVGHSMGEVAAAYVAGILTLEDAARIICRRSQLVKRVSGAGGMMLVELSLDDARRVIAPYGDAVSVAASNSPTTTVLAGEVAPLQDVLAALEKQEVFTRWIKVDYASHSAQMDSLRDDLLDVLRDVVPSRARVPFYSTVVAAPLVGPECDAEYWVRNLRDPVLFSTTIANLRRANHDAFVELSPHPTLLSSIQESDCPERAAAFVQSSLRRDEDDQFVAFSALAAIYTRGWSVRWSALHPCDERNCIDLPAYPWQRERLNLVGEIKRSAGRASPGAHPVMGSHVQASEQPDTHLWESSLALEHAPFLREHRVHGTVIYPASAYLDMALTAGEDLFGPGAAMLQDVQFVAALPLADEVTRTLQFTVTPAMVGSLRFRVWSVEERAKADESPWELHAEGTLLRPGSDTNAVPRHAHLDDIRARCAEPRSGTEFYETMERAGLEYSGRFRGIESIWRCDGEALARVAWPDVVSSEAPQFTLHPAVLDTAFQLLMAAVPRTTARATYMPVGLRELRVPSPVDVRACRWAHAVFTAPVDGDSLDGDVVLLDDAGQVLVEAIGLRARQFDGGEKRRDGGAGLPLLALEWKESPLVVEEPHAAQAGVWLILTDAGGVGAAVGDSLRAQGHDVLFAAPGEDFTETDRSTYQCRPGTHDDFQQLLGRCCGLTGVVYLWGLDARLADEASADALSASQELGCLPLVDLVQSLVGCGEAPRLVVVTAGSQPADDGPLEIAQAPLIGLGRVIRQEHPELRCTLIDLSPGIEPGEIAALAVESVTNTDEREVALRGTRRLVPRLARRADPSRRPVEESVAQVPAGERAFYLDVTSAGTIDNLCLKETSRPRPGPSEVEIEVVSATLNFRDVMKVLGIYPEPADALMLGDECSGIVSAVGERVTDFHVGDPVVAAPQGSLARYVRVAAARTRHKPPHLTFDQAATIPIAYGTAYYALQHLAHLAAGERVLIHAAAGGVGLAAVYIALQRGAEIFATAGSPAKRAFLEQAGVHHVMDSRSLAFVDEVRAATAGHGVDVILNSLAGEALAKSLSLLAPYGRFLEIGRRDIYGNSRIGLRAFDANQSFFGVEIERLGHERPDLADRLFREILAEIEDGRLPLLPITSFSLCDVTDAFRLMASSGHIGRVVLHIKDEPVLMNAPASGRRDDPVIDKEGTYLISGGLGGLGLAAARWIVEHGGRSVVLVSRRAPSPEAQTEIEALAALGARIVVRHVDVTSRQLVDDLMREVRTSLPPLRGILHAAAVLDDGIVMQLDRTRFRNVLDVKVLGAWNLHTATRTDALDFFVMFSSAASMLGSPGQGSYAAGNAFLDALAHYRRRQGHCGLSINWGQWATIGFAAAGGYQERLAERGLAPIDPVQGFKTLERLLAHAESAQVGVIPIDVEKWVETSSDSRGDPLFRELITQRASDTAGSDGGFRETLLAAPAGPERRALLESHIVDQLARVLRLSTSRIDTRIPFGRMGVDSLMGLEFRNRLESSLNIRLPATMIWNHPTVSALATFVGGRMDLSLDSPPPTTEASTARALHEIAGVLEQLRLAEQSPSASAPGVS
jgi:acyl transferase domain-containing protein/acyl carrier protein